MSRVSNMGIILYTTGDAAAGSVQMVTNTTQASSTIDVQAAQRLVLTIYHAFGNQTSYVYRVQLTNNNLFGAFSAGSAPPSVTGGSTDSNLNAVTPILSVAQNDDSTAGINVIDHTYSSATGTTRDVIEVAGALAGLLSVRLTTASAAPNSTAVVKIALDIY